ncbi:enoyl-CoA hydratase/isomerase family protein [Bosea sp. (in: a-proteobacteria)]|uniref:enoyl-CoA hydratase/isomerase family protein n=1 Tax=Bosea sp. (in: a-proteobacteria) TaxID=1871050 RepID=UPI002FC74414
MTDFILTERRGRVGIITLNRPDILNAWHRPMRGRLMEALEQFDSDATIGAIILTGAGDRAFGAGQDLNETKTFDEDGAEGWMHEWDRLYDQIRSLTKPLVVALNGLAAGSAFQIALLADFRIGHAGVKMGQPEIKSGIPSSTGPWIMKEILGLARTIDLTLTGRMMNADECERIGVINKLVAADKVLDEAMALSELLADQPPVAMRLTKARFRESTQAAYEDCMKAGIRIQREAYKTGEPARMMEKFLAKKVSSR